MGKRKKKSTSVTYVYDPNSNTAEGNTDTITDKSTTTDTSPKEEAEGEEGQEKGPQLSKNKRRKLQKKKREKELKADAKIKKQEAVEFVYDPESSVLVLKGQEIPKEINSPKDVDLAASSSPADQHSGELHPTESSGIPPPSPTKEQPDAPPDKYRDMILEFRKPSMLSRENEVKEFFKTILALMKEECQNYFGEEDTNKFHQTELSCGKLFLLLDKKDVSKEILRDLCTIKRKLVMQEYDEAQGVYFALTIGNAPWPTMLGSKSILEDEEKRKTLQAIKRLMTFFQQRIAPKPIT